MAAFRLSVNGKRHTVDAAPDTPLLWVLRDAVGLTGTKYGCGIGMCGACSVHLDGELAAQKAGWGSALPEGRGRGIAVHESFGSFVAEVAEVSVADDGTVRVHRVVCAIDCGQFVNPDTVEAQMESGIVYGLTAALRGAITIEKGRVQQSNFHDYPMLRINEMPAVEVFLAPSGDAHGGVGEPGTPTIAPAVVNAIGAATGKRVRSLPIRAEALRRA